MVEVSAEENQDEEKRKAREGKNGSHWETPTTKSWPSASRNETRECTAPVSVAMGAFMVFLLLVQPMILVAAQPMRLVKPKTSNPTPVLTYVHMIWRHGDRAPSHLVPNIPFNSNAFPNGLGNLTEIGFAQLKSVGERIRQRYRLDQYSSIHPLENPYPQVHIRSTNHTRTIMSAYALIQGLQLPVEIPIELTVAMKHDWVGNPFFKCPRAMNIFDRVKTSILLQDQYQSVYDTLKQKIQYPSGTEVYPVFDQINCMKANNMPIPTWVTDELMRSMRALSWNGLEAHFGIGKYSDTTMNKLRGGNILRGVLDQLEARIKCNKGLIVDDLDCDNEFFYGLSAHDITLGALLTTFADWKTVLGTGAPMIEYGAHMAFELYKSLSGYKLKVLYANRHDQPLTEISTAVKGCGRTECDAEAFISASRSLHFDDPIEQCYDGASETKRSAKFFEGNLVEYFS